MSFLSHLLKHRNANLSDFAPVFMSDERIGWTRCDFVERLTSGHSPWHRQGDGIALDNTLQSFAARSQAIHDFFLALSKQNHIPDLPDFTLLGGDDWLEVGDRSFQVHRFYSAYLGIRRRAVIVNGFEDGHYWAAVRSTKVDEGAGLYDALIAGAVKIDHSLQQSLLEEGEEECGLTQQELPHLKPVRDLHVAYHNSKGFLIDEVFHLYDFDTKGSFQPRVVNPEEVESFKLLSCRDLIPLVDEKTRFKSQINVVVTDFLLRHGYLTPAHKDYDDILFHLTTPIAFDDKTFRTRTASQR